MKSVRAYILNKYRRKLESLPEGPEKERLKGKIYNYLERCKKRDIKRDAKQRIYHA